MGVVAWLLGRGPRAASSARGASRAQLVDGPRPGGGGIVAYALLTRALRVGEAEVLWRMVRAAAGAAWT